MHVSSAAAHMVSPENSSVSAQPVVATQDPSAGRSTLDTRSIDPQAWGGDASDTGGRPIGDEKERPAASRDRVSCLPSPPTPCRGGSLSAPGGAQSNVTPLRSAGAPRQDRTGKSEPSGKSGPGAQAQVSNDAVQGVGTRDGRQSRDDRAGGGTQRAVARADVAPKKACEASQASSVADLFSVSHTAHGDLVGSPLGRTMSGVPSGRLDFNADMDRGNRLAVGAHDAGLTSASTATRAFEASAFQGESILDKISDGHFSKVWKNVDTVKAQLLSDEIGHVDTSFENPTCLWQGPHLTPQQKLRYYFDCKAGLQAYNEYVAAQGGPRDEWNYPSNHVLIVRGFEMRIGYIEKDPEVRAYLGSGVNDFMQKVFEAFPRRGGAAGTMYDQLKSLAVWDLERGATLNFAGPKAGLSKDDAMRTYLREYALVGPLLAPADREEVQRGMVRQIWNFTSGGININSLGPRDFDQLANFYHLGQGDSVENAFRLSLQGAARSLAAAANYDPVKTAQDLFSCFRTTVNLTRKGLKWSEALAKSAGQPWNVSPETAQVYRAGLIHILDAFAAGGVLAARNADKRGLSPAQISLLTLQTTSFAGLAIEGGTKLGPKIFSETVADVSYFSAKDIESTAKIVGGMSGMAAGFVGLVASAGNPDRAAKALGMIGGTFSAIGSGASALEGVLSFAGTNDLNALVRSIGNRAYNALLSSYSPTGRYAGRLNAVLWEVSQFTSRTFGSYGARIGAVSLAGLGAVASGVGEVMATGLFLYDFIKQIVDAFKHAKQQRHEMNLVLGPLIGRMLEYK